MKYRWKQLLDTRRWISLLLVLLLIAGCSPHRNLPIQGLKRATKSVGPLEGRVVAIDPGHGGSDPGAMGPSGVLEKDIALKVGLEVASLLRKQGATVVMTREGDYQVENYYHGPKSRHYGDLYSRVTIGLQAGAEVFVSIHCNSEKKDCWHGAQTFYYSRSPESKELAEAIQQEVASSLSSDRQATVGHYQVISNPTMPSALVEVGFLSNPEDERELASDVVQRQIARSIAAGIEKFLTSSSH